MKLKKILAAALAAALCLSLILLPAGAAEPFPDITDSRVAEAAGLLRQLGVLNGDEKGNFNPDSPLTRAQFCKMAIEMRGEGDKATALMSYTFFRDVKGDHWARGYINYASRIIVGENERLVMGVGDGNFLPDDTIKFAEAVTMTLRLLGYSREAVASGSQWYEGYLTTAAGIGLTKDITCAWDAPVTRADAARLFYNLLFVKPLRGGATFFEAMGGATAEKVLVLDTDATAADGSPALTVAKDGRVTTYKTGDFTPDPALVGSTVSLKLDKEERIIALETLSTPSRREVTVAMVGSDHILTQSGERMVIPSATTVYEGTRAFTYGDVAASLAAGSRLTLCANAAGQLEFAFLTRAASPTGEGTSRTVTLSVAEVNYLRTDGDERIAVTADTSVYLGGERTTYGAVYMDLTAGLDLTLSYSAAGALEYIFLSESVSASNQIVARLTCVYEDASPSPRTPLVVQALNERFTVLDSAVEELARFSPGDQVTLLLTRSGKVAGVEKPEKNPSTLVGMVTAGDNETATVTPVLDLKDASGGAITFSGAVSAPAGALVGELVTISSSQKGTMTLRRATPAVSGALNVEAGTLGGVPLAGQVFLYERAGGRALPIRWEQVTIPTVPAEKIAYAGVNELGQVNVIVLNDVTGDGYTYGYLKARTETVEVPATGSFAAFSYEQYYIDATNASGTGGYRTRSMAADYRRKSVPGGVATQADGWAVTVPLTEITKVSRNAFNMEDMTVTLGGVVYPIAGNVQCYNSATGVWFAPGRDGVNAARAYAASVSVYYDKSPSEGGKVRMIVVK